MSNDISNIKNKAQFRIMEKRINEAKAAKRLSYEEYQALSKLLFEKSGDLQKKNNSGNQQQKDYVENFIKRIKQHKMLAAILIILIAITSLAQVTGALNNLYEMVESPAPKLNVAVYDYAIQTTNNSENTTFVNLNVTFPAHITNNGKAAAHIVVCDLFLHKDGKPAIDNTETLTEICYLKTQESFSYNFTKSFNVSIPAKPLTAEAIKEVSSYFILVGYWYGDDFRDIKQQWIEYNTDWIK